MLNELWIFIEFWFLFLFILYLKQLWVNHQLNKFGSGFGSRMFNELWVFHRILVFYFSLIVLILCWFCGIFWFCRPWGQGIWIRCSQLLTRKLNQQRSPRSLSVSCGSSSTTLGTAWRFANSNIWTHLQKISIMGFLIFVLFFNYRNAGFDPTVIRVDPYGNVLYYHADLASPLAWDIDHWFPCSSI